MAKNLFILCYKNINFTNMCLVRTCVHLKNSHNLNPNFLTINFINNVMTRCMNTSSTVPNFESGKELVMSNLQEYKSKNGAGIKYATQKLHDLFHIPLPQAKDLVKKFPKLAKCNVDVIEKNYYLCQKSGLTNDTLLQYPVLLTMNDIECKLNFVQDLLIDINLIAPLLTAGRKDLKRMVLDAKMEERYVPHGHRILYLSELLNLPAPEICEKLVNHSYILRMPLERLETILKVLLDYGVEPKNIMNDCWSLRYNPQMAEERLQRAIAANVTKVKTWMIRCQDKVFERCINRQVENRKVLGSHSSVEEYLSQRLECSLDNAKYLTEKYPAITKMNILKMKEILDFLYAEGYTPLHICRVPRIVIHSLETTKQRLEQLKRYGYTPPTLAILCKSKRDFDKILKKCAIHKKNAEMQKANKREN